MPQDDGFLGDDIDMSLSRLNTARVVRDGFDRTISAVLEAGKRLVVVRNVPEMDFDASACEFKNLILPVWAGRECQLSIARFHANTIAVDTLLEDLRDRHPDLEILEVADLICSSAFCSAELDGILLYKWGDRSHLSMAGSRALGRAYLDRHGRL